jgi:hypothetical protein
VNVCEGGWEKGGGYVWLCDLAHNELRVEKKAPSLGSQGGKVTNVEAAVEGAAKRTTAEVRKLLNAADARCMVGLRGKKTSRKCMHTCTMKKKKKSRTFLALSITRFFTVARA